MSPPSPAVELEIELRRVDASRYSVELQARSADSEVNVAPIRRTTTFDLQGLQVAEWGGAEAVGRALTDGVFGDPAVLAYYQNARVAAESSEATLRVRLFIDSTAPELHALKWELLRRPPDPTDRLAGQMLATSERVLFSRHLSSYDWRPVKLRPREKLRALVAIANPSGLDTGQLRRWTWRASDSGPRPPWARSRSSR